ncbi:MAG: heme ABC transporter ATP-binding protein [Chthoniobacterales bacterium]
MLKAENISVRIGAKQVLRAVDFCVQPGEMLAVLGPNGAGKSTLMRVLSGDIPPTEGKTFYDGREIYAWDRKELACRRAVLSQFTEMHMPFRAVEIVMMGRAPHSRNSSFANDHRIAMEVMEQADVAHLSERTMDTLSGGEQQRVHWARVSAQIWRPPSDKASRYLLLDEPISSLDIAHQHSALALARKMADDGMAVFIILHDLNIAAQYADHLLFLKNGRSIAYGTPREVLTSETLRKGFEIDAIIKNHPVDGTPSAFIPRKRP